MKPVQRSALLLMLICGVVACRGQRPVTISPPPPDGAVVKEATVGLSGTWHWVKLMADGDSLLLDQPDLFTLTFEAADRVALRVDCNRGTETVRMAGDSLRLDHPMLTKVYCGPESRDRRFLDLLERVQRYRQQGDSLIFELENSGGTMHFARR